MASHSKIRPASNTAPCFFLSKSDVFKENKNKPVPTKIGSNFSKVERHRLSRKMENNPNSVVSRTLKYPDSQQVPPKRSKVLSSKKPKTDDEKVAGSLVEILIPDSIECKSLDAGRISVKIPLVSQRRNSFHDIGARKELLAQPSTSTESTSFEADVTAHCSVQNTFVTSGSMKSKSNLTSFRRRKSKRFTEARTSGHVPSTSSNKGQHIKVKSTLQKKRSV